MTPQSIVNLPKTHLKTAQNSESRYKKRVKRAVFALVSLERLLRVNDFHFQCKGRLSGLKLDVGMARAFGMAGKDNADSLPRSFNFGWATSHPIGVDEVLTLVNISGNEIT